MATSSGDEGMDASLFKPTDDDDVVLQFSLRKDWDQKIRQTCSRLKETAPGNTLEEARMLLGARPKAGEQGLTDDIRRRLIAAARDR